MARRKKTRSRRSKKLNINIVDAGAFLMMGTAITHASEFLGTGRNAIPEIAKGSYGWALRDMATNLRNKNVQRYLISVGLGSVLVKGIAKSLRVSKIAGLGPINLKV